MDFSNDQSHGQASSWRTSPNVSEDNVEPFRRLADSIPHVFWITQLNPERVIYVSPSFEAIWGRKPQELYADARLWTACIHPDDREHVEEQFVGWITGTSRECRKLEYRVVQPSGALRWVTDHGVVTFDQSGKAVRVSGVSTDITDLKLAEQEHLAHLAFLESLDRVNQAIQRTNDLEQMMSDVLEAVLQIFRVDRAWLAFPCDPDAPPWRIMLERQRAGLPAAKGEVTDHASLAGASEVLEAARARTDIVAFGPGSGALVPNDIAEEFDVRAILCTPLRPKVGTRYVFGLHQCSVAREWTPREQQLFREIGRRLADAIGTLWTFRSLRESEARLEAAQRQARLGYWSLDVEAEIVTWSDETFRICGMQPRGLPLRLAEADELIHPSDRERVRQARVRALSGTGDYAVEYRTYSIGSGLRFVNSEGHVVRDASGHPTGIFGTLQDITIRKRAEQLFSTQHTVTRLLAEATIIEDTAQRVLCAIGESLAWDFAVLWRVEAATQSLRCSELWSAPGLQAYTFEQATRTATFVINEGLPGLSWKSREPLFIADVQREPEFVRRKVATEAGFHSAFAFPVVTASGVWGVLEFFTRERRARDVDLLTTMSTLGSQIGQFVERVDAERALHQARDQLAHVTRVASLGEVTASIAHEVNQPLTGIVANANAALRWLDQSPPQLHEAVEALKRLARDGKRAGEVVARLRTLVRKGEEPSKSTVDANQLIRETLPLIRSEIQQNDVNVRLALSPDLAPVHADRVQLQQVVLNLIVNALEALGAQQSRRRELAIESRDHDVQSVTISIIDNAAGLLPENVTRIFDPFFTTKPQGLGMGLAISRSIIEDHGGRLSVSSTTAGSTFEFTLCKAT